MYRIYYINRLGLKVEVGKVESFDEAYTICEQLNSIAFKLGSPTWTKFEKITGV